MNFLSSIKKAFKILNSRVKVPTILQMEATECGAASLAMILANFGLWLPFVVLEGIKDDKVYLNDPALGRRIVKWEEFRSSYTGVALHIVPNENFKPEGRRYNILKVVAEMSQSRESCQVLQRRRS